MPEPQDRIWDADGIMVALARGRGQIAKDDDRPTEEIVAELAEHGRRQQEIGRQLNRTELLEGDIELDPELYAEGDEVAEELVTEYHRVVGAKQEGFELMELTERDPRLGGVKSKFSREEQRSAAQYTQDLMLERRISTNAALELAASEYGVSKDTITRWASRHGIDIGGFRAQLPRGDDWDLQHREELFGRQLAAISLLTDRAIVWLQNPTKAPPDWNAENAIKSIAISAAIVHDKRTGIEDLKVARGIRDLDSEELQGELAQGRQRLLQMRGTEG